MEGALAPAAPRAAARRYAIVLAAVAALLLLVRLGAKDVWEASEGRPLQSAREMRLQGDRLVQYTNGQVDLTKPPLYAWATSAAFALFGESEAAGRLPSVLATLGILALTFGLARRAAGPRAGLLAGLVCLTTARFLHQARLAELETLLALCVLSAQVALFAGLEAPPGRRRALCFAAFHLAAGLAFAVKGPISLLLTLPAAVAAAVSVRRGHALLSPAFLATAPLWALTALPWYVAVVVRDPAAKDVFLSYARGENVGHLHAAWEYLLTWPVNALPWAPLVVLGFARPFSAAAPEPERTRLRLSAVTFATTFVVLSCVPAKQSHYLIPIYPHGAVLAGALLDRFLRARPPWATRLAAAGLAAGVALCLVGVAWVLPARNERESARRFFEAVDARVPAGAPLSWTVFGSHSDYLWYLSPARVGTHGIPETTAQGDEATAARTAEFLAGDLPRYAIVTLPQATLLSKRGAVLLWTDVVQKKSRRLALVSNPAGAKAP